MKNMEFSYHNPTGIEFGKGKIKEIANLIPKDNKVLVVYGGGGLLKQMVHTTKLLKH